MRTLTLLIAPNGKSVAKEPDPFHAGQGGNPVTIVVVNGDATYGHDLELVKIKHLPTGQHVDPLTGRKKWRTPPGVSVDSQHRVKSTANAGRYSYVIRLDEGDLADPEIVVEPPPAEGDPKRKTGPRRRAVTKKTAKKKAAKKASGKKKGAKKKARRR